MSEVIKLPMSLGENETSFTRPAGYVYEFHVKGRIKSPEEYIDWTRTIRSATAQDVIELHLNTEGGDAYTAIELMGALKDTEAHVHVVVDGMCASAGTMLFVTGNSYEINPYSTFMFHNYSGAALGKGHELQSKVEYDTKWAKRLMTDIYKNLLTKKEIKQLLDGKDLWMNADNISKRLEALIVKDEYENRD